MKIKKFEIKLWIKNKKTQEIIELNKIDDLEVLWKGNWGEAKKKVKFEKKGKSFWILVRIELKKYLLGTRDTIVKDEFFASPNADYEIYHGYQGEPNNSPEKDKERWDKGVKIINQWNIGRIIGFSCLILIIIIASFLVWKRSEKYQRLTFLLCLVAFFSFIIMLVSIS